MYGIALKILILLLDQLDKAMITVYTVLFQRTKEKGDGIQGVSRGCLRKTFMMILMFERYYRNFFSLHSARWAKLMCRGKDRLQL